MPDFSKAELKAALRPRAGRCWRITEAQHITSTLQLVDSLDEQALLEQELETSKPILPPPSSALSPIGRAAPSEENSNAQIREEGSDIGGGSGSFAETTSRAPSIAQVVS